MPAEFTDRILSLRSLARHGNYGTARDRLAVAASLADRDPPAAASQVLAAVPYLEPLPRSLKRLAWLETFGAPGGIRSAHASAIHGHWIAGINRSCDGGRPGHGVARLLAVAARVEAGSMPSWLLKVARCEAFVILLPRIDAESLAREGIELARLIDPVASEHLAEAAITGGLPAIAGVGELSSWLGTLRDPGAAPRRPPDSGLAELALKWPYLRGLRRRAARRHGEEIARKVNAARVGLPEGSERTLDIHLPDCFQGSSSQAPLLAPLVIDLLTKAVADVSAWTGPRPGIRTLVNFCPSLIDESSKAIDPATTRDQDRTSRREWLERLLGLTGCSEELAAWSPA